ncbi:cation:proton antiporter [Rubricoccus marinus]|uniref:Sodium:proton antiporter n=1 Tax=Rubricoccus marinus TaxID=716817 RepID=A0A259U0N0_9BACT|nr:cation:proton antiporter [Rubricoccus marinus]OZC03500.1 sodium:proton antiporter [Rubricoccus marinus]
MPFSLWFIIAGALLTLMALMGTTLKRLPLSTAQVYLLVGIGIGPLGIGLLVFDPIEHARILEILSEIAVILSLFAAGLKLRTPLSDGRWRLPLRLATISMTVTVGLVAVAGKYLLGLPWGAAVLLGAVLAPTDPVLASDVQIRQPDDRDRLRFSLTGEAGFNDGAAFPFVMLGLGMLGLRDLGEWGWKWWAVDVFWAILGGIAIGWLLGRGVGRLVVYLRQKHKEAVGADDFLALGLVALSYGIALYAHSYAFLAVFAAGLALRYEERRHTGDKPSEEVEEMARQAENEEVALDENVAPAWMATAVLGFAEQAERMGAVVLVVLVGALMTYASLTWETLAFVAVLFLGIRPLAVSIGLLGSRTTGIQRGLMAWFGIRGIGSIYYLMYAEVHGVYDLFSGAILGVVLTTIAASVVVHGLSVTPIMEWYGRRKESG